MYRNLVLITFIFSTLCSQADDSVCFGNTANGRLENGVKLALSGDNFTTYSYLASLLGRTYVHSMVKVIVENAYESLSNSDPQKVYKYAETGFERGGKFKPHKTHQNGLSVDFMTPVTNGDGTSVHLPTNPLNKYGYNIDFDANGQFDDLAIDYDALAAHIVALHKEALAQGVDLWRVIFDPELQPNLFETKYADYLKQHITFSKKRSWVRHDDHYHVDFRIPCKPNAS